MSCGTYHLGRGKTQPLVLDGHMDPLGIAPIHLDNVPLLLGMKVRPKLLCELAQSPTFEIIAYGLISAIKVFWTTLTLDCTNGHAVWYARLRADVHTYH